MTWKRVLVTPVAGAGLISEILSVQDVVKELVDGTQALAKRLN